MLSKGWDETGGAEGEEQSGLQDHESFVHVCTCDFLIFLSLPSLRLPNREQESALKLAFTLRRRAVEDQLQAIGTRVIESKAIPLVAEGAK